MIRRTIRRLSRALERFNSSFGGTAVAVGTLNSGHRGANVDSVVAVLGELEKEGGDGEEKAAG